MVRIRKNLSVFALVCFPFLTFAQTVSVNERGQGVGHEDQFCIESTCVITFGTNTMTVTPGYGGDEAKQIYTITKDVTPLTLSSQKVVPVCLRHPTSGEYAGRTDYNVASLATPTTLNFGAALGDITAFIATGGKAGSSLSAITLTPKNIVGANEGIVMRADDDGWYCIPVTATGPDYSKAQNLFIISTGSEGDKSDGKTYYALSSRGTFSLVTKTNEPIPEGKIYFKWAEVASAKELYLDFFGTATGLIDIEQLKNNQASGDDDDMDVNTYDIQGRKVNGLHHGLLIRNGKKILIK